MDDYTDPTTPSVRQLTVGKELLIDQLIRVIEQDLFTLSGGEGAAEETGSSYGVGQAGLNVTVAGKTVNKNQRAKLPPDAPVIGDVLLGGGLAGDYFALGREVMADILAARGIEVDVDPPPVIDLREHDEEVVAV